MLTRIDADIKTALLAGDKATAATLRMLKSALHNARIAKGDELDDAEVVRVLQKEAKQRRESMAGFTSGGRTEQAAAEAAELAVIEQYLPTPLSATELEQIVDEALKSTGATTSADIGAVMRIVQPQIAGRADGGTVAALVRSRLQ